MLKNHRWEKIISWGNKWSNVLWIDDIDGT